MITELLPYAQVGSTLLVGLGLFINAVQYWRGRKLSTLQHILDFFKSTNEREASLADAQDENARRHAFVEFLNFLEIYSAAVNSNVFAGVADELVRDKLIDTIDVLESFPQWHHEVAKSKTSATTYKQLARFIKRNEGKLHAPKFAALLAASVLPVRAAIDGSAATRNHD